MDELHENIKSRRQLCSWERYADESFYFQINTFSSKRSPEFQRKLVESFSYLAFKGPIRARGASNEFAVFEEFEVFAPAPRAIYFGRVVGVGNRRAIKDFDLKKRKYIATTSMDAELALITANMSHAGPGRIMYDPFVGTAGFPIACANFGALTFGSDIDGRSVRGTGPERSVRANFAQYKMADRWLGGFAADLTNTPIRDARFLDCIVCDPPYGVREALKVLGSRGGTPAEMVMANGKPAHT